MYIIKKINQNTLVLKSPSNLILRKWSESTQLKPGRTAFPYHLGTTCRNIESQT